MKLVVDNDSNVEPLPITSYADISGKTRELADKFDAGEYGDATRVLVIVQCEDGSLTTLILGENTSPYETMGILEASKLRVFADDLVDDE